MAANMTETRDQETTGIEMTERHGTGQRRGRRTSGLAAALLACALIGGVAMHDRRASHPTVPAIPRIVAGGAETRSFGTTNRPNAATAEHPPVATNNPTDAERRFLDVNTVWLPTVGAAEVAPSAPTSGQRRLLEVNTAMLPAESAYPYAEGLTPSLGQRR